MKLKDRIKIALDFFFHGEHTLDVLRDDLRTYAYGNDAVIVHHNTFVKLASDGGNNAIIYETEESLYNGSSLLILMDSELFYDAPNYVREFVINHEIGHYKLGHFNEGKLCSEEERTQMTREGKISQYERDADMYAVNKLGPTRALQVFDWLIDNVHANIENRNDLILRKQAIIETTECE